MTDRGRFRTGGSRGKRSATQGWRQAVVGALLGGCATMLGPAPGVAQAAGVDLRNIQGTWTKLCGRVATGPTCFTTAAFGQDGSKTVTLAIYDPEGKPKIFRALVPLGVLQQPGIVASVNGRRIAKLRFTVCNGNGCYAEATISNSVLGRLSDDAEVAMSFQSQLGDRLTFNLPLAGFQAAFDGPASSAAAGQ